MISESVRERIRQQAGDRCGYCRAHQQYVFAPLEIDHLRPQAQGGSDAEDNLWLACRMCNGYKAAQTHAVDPVSAQKMPLFDPRRQHWTDHFAWSQPATHIIGRTPCGRATVEALQLNNSIAVLVRQAWIDAGWHPPTE